VLFEFANVFVFIILGLLMSLVIITVSRALAPRVPDVPDKFTTYECGERPTGSAWILFNFRFYAVALAFLIFDIELALIFPCVAVFDEWRTSGQGFIILAEIVLFLAVLFLGLIYMARRGDLRWSKEVPAESNERALLDEEKPITF
jgi:NADH-quinone oxidoreductase subunit A